MIFDQSLLVSSPVLPFNKQEKWKEKRMQNTSQDSTSIGAQGVKPTKNCCMSHMRKSQKMH